MACISRSARDSRGVRLRYRLQTTPLRTRRAPILQFLKSLERDDVFRKADLAGVRTIEARYPKFADGFPEGLKPGVVAACRKLGIERLYAHQADAIEHVLAGEDIVLISPTATGKTLCFNLPVVSGIQKHKRRRALYLYPMKALANDQRAALLELTKGLPDPSSISSWVIDGDTEKEHRKLLKAAPPHIIITNPDTLHLSLLGWNEQWTTFLKDLRYVVLDEAHEYRGYFGINVAFAVRRLLALCAALDTHPQVIVSSATIANPIEHAGALTGRDVRLVEAKDAGQPKKHWVFLNPEYQDFRYEDVLMRKLASLTSTCVREGVSALVFCPTRRFVERLHRQSRDVLREEGLNESLIAPYKAGYTPDERREIERGLKEGSVLVVFSTNALEIGIDMGRLDMVVMVGFPDTVMSAWQRAGRAGRSFDKEALVLMIASRSAIDQFYVDNIDLFMNKPLDRIALNLENRELLGPQALCAIFELRGDKRTLTPEILGPALADAAEKAKPDLKLLERSRPEMRVSMRSIYGSTYTIMSKDEKEIGTISGDKLFSEVYQGAIYDHYGRSWRVASRSTDSIYVEPNSLFHHTKPSRFWQIQPGEPGRGWRWTDRDYTMTLMFGEVEATDTLTGYREFDEKTGDIVNEVFYDAQQTKRFKTDALWLSVEGRRGKSTSELYVEVHSAEHGVRAIVPLAIPSDPFDLSGITVAKGPYGDPTLYLYDAVAGGIGISEAIVDGLAEMLAPAKSLTKNCSCKTSCPRCIQISRCSEDNEHLSRLSALRFLDALGSMMDSQVPLELDTSRMEWV